MSDRHWHTDLRCWVYDSEINEALDAAQLALTEYHNGDREFAERWLMRALAANSEQKA